MVQVRPRGARTMRLAQLTTAGAGVLLLVDHGVFVVLGRLNGDEAFYLHAARLVWAGQVPFRDFGFTQSPLLPYVHGPVQLLLGGSLLGGRIWSALLALGAAALAIRIARRSAGRTAAAVTAILLAAFTSGAYFHSIVKTYALTSLLFVATLSALVSNRSARTRYTASVALAGMAALTRLTAVAFLLPVLLLGFSDRRSRKPVAALALGMIGIAAVGTIVDPGGVFWGLLGHHLDQWEGGIVHVIKDLFSVRALAISTTLAPFVLTAAFASWGRNGRRASSDRTGFERWIYVTGLVLFAGAHVLTGSWHDEYLVPAVAGAIPVVGIEIGSLLDSTQERSIRSLATGAVVILVSISAFGGLGHLDLSGHRTPIAETRGVAAAIERHSLPDTSVFALSALWAVVEADRPAIPGLDLAQFSVTDVDEQTAERLHLVNVKMVIDLIRNRAAPSAVITSGDRRVISNKAADPAGAVAAFDRALRDNYDAVATFASVGHRREAATLYVARSERPHSSNSNEANP